MRSGRRKFFRRLNHAYAISPRAKMKRAALMNKKPTRKSSRAIAQNTPQAVRWSTRRSIILLAALTVVCLLPFAGEAFRVDDPLFLWSAQQIVQHPLNPYGFAVVWYTTSQSMAEVTQNPPLASYYIAAVASIAGWSEAALHLAFLLPAMIAILGAYLLARRFTRWPLLAALATLFTPAFLVSSTSLMCDVMMLAAWIVASLLWMEALDRNRAGLFALSGAAIAICALTKYFGIALIPLLLVYTIVRQRRLTIALAYLLIPLAAIAGYSYWTQALYGRSLLLQAFSYTHTDRVGGGFLAKTLTGVSFLGGCFTPVLFLMPLSLRRRWIAVGAAIAALGSATLAGHWIPLNSIDHVELNRAWFAVELGAFLLGGIVVIAITIKTFKQDADSLLLALWVAGTFIFASYLNWTVNARSFLPLIPASAILLSRAIEWRNESVGWRWLVPPLAASAAIALWVTAGDAALANSARTVAEFLHQNAQRPDAVSFEGHWGFQYYMQSFGFKPVDVKTLEVEDGNVIVIPENSASTVLPPAEVVESQTLQSFELNRGVTTIGTYMGAGFYSDAFGPLPYSFGPVPQERYAFLRLRAPQ